MLVLAVWNLPLLDIRGIINRMSMVSAGRPIAALRAQACYLKHAMQKVNDCSSFDK